MSLQSFAKSCKDIAMSVVAQLPKAAAQMVVLELSSEIRVEYLLQSVIQI